MCCAFGLTGLVCAEHQVTHAILTFGVADGAQQREVALVAVDDELARRET